MARDPFLFVIIVYVSLASHQICPCSGKGVSKLSTVLSRDDSTPVNRFMWDASTSTWKDYFMNYCAVSCNKAGIQEVWRRICPSLKCYPCDCNKWCHFYGSCCLSSDSPEGEEDGFSTEHDSNIIGTLSCKFPPSPPYQDRTHYLMVTKCPKTWSDSDIRRKCEKPEKDSLDDITPYTVHQSGLTFSNMHCAICHGYIPFLSPDQQFQSNSSHVLPWQMSITCKHYQYLYTIGDRFHFYKEASLLHRDFCRVLYIKPTLELFPLKTCQPWLQSRSVVDTCSVDIPHISELCHDLQPRLSYEVIGYKNIFCALCNNVVPEEIQCPLPGPLIIYYPEKPLKTLIPSIFILFSITKPSHKHNLETFEKCSENKTWENNQGECILPTCTKGKELGEDGQCRSIIPQIQGLGYNLTVVFTTPNITVISKDAASNISEVIFEILQTFVSELDIAIVIHVDLDSNRNTEEDGILRKIEISGHILAATSVKRDDFEEIMANFTERGLDMYEGDNTYNNISNVYNISLRRSHLGSFISNLENHSDFYLQTQMSPCAARAFGEEDLDPPFEFEGETLPGQKVYSFYRITPCGNVDLWDALDLFIDYTYTLTCPFISFNVTRAPIIENDIIIFTFMVKGTEINISSDTRLSYEDGLLHVCLDVLNDHVEETLRRDRYQIFQNSAITVAEYYIEIICLGISIIFLVISIITYLLFPSLRSLPGLNNMCLSLSLLAAQTSLLITSLFGIRGYIPKIYCLVHATFLHYSWLATFMWMNICCIHMYRVFTSTGNQFNESQSDKRRHRRYCIYAFGIPAFFVVLIIGVTILASGGASTGYNDEICFLDTFYSILLIILGFLVPFAITSFSNAALFVLTVRRIAVVSRMAEQVTTRKSHGVMAYVKLSTLTGAFCVLAAVAVQFKSPILALLASPFAALQGLFIFLSFLANKHVLGLYRSLFGLGGKRVANSSDSQQNSRKTIDTRLTPSQNHKTTTNI